jgi:hypothetical protein
MEFPADLVPLVFSFLDPPSLARMAQTSHAWRTLVYRSSTWLPFLWKPKVGYRHLFEIRKGARHIGEPHALCFLTWVHHYFYSNSPQILRPDLPPPEKGEDALRYVRKAYRSWCSEKKPCLHTHHYEWTDVFILPLSKMSPAEVLALKYEVCEEWAPSLYVLESSYAAWLSENTRFYEAVWGHPPLRKPTVSDAPITRLQQIQEDYAVQRYAIQTELVTLGDRIWNSHKKSYKALQRSQTQRVFDANERVVVENNTWDAAAFTLPRPKEESESETHKTPPPSGAPGSLLRLV